MIYRPGYAEWYWNGLKHGLRHEDGFVKYYVKGSVVAIRPEYDEEFE
jgi:hypothetical protein